MRKVPYVSVRRKALSAVVAGLLMGAFWFVVMLADDATVAEAAARALLTGLLFGVIWGLLWSAWMTWLHRRSQQQGPG
ncbi:hypothetical protein [Nocardioides sp. LHG3406-4]|uniref:hypothetical protein n=1 Tax=Nocardioides sp. LHG3406-4 TaxID=2804575 RepID=UPI003CEE945E